MATGTVKWFNETKGYGFIQPDQGGKDVFVHISAVERSGMNGLAEGMKVTYDVEADRKSGKESATNLKWPDQRHVPRRAAHFDALPSPLYHQKNEPAMLRPDLRGTRRHIAGRYPVSLHQVRRSGSGRVSSLAMRPWQASVPSED